MLQMKMCGFYHFRLTFSIQWSWSILSYFMALGLGMFVLLCLGIIPYQPPK